MFKIIFKDKPDEIVEVTEPSQLANTKVGPLTPDEMEQVRAGAIKAGWHPYCSDTDYRKHRYIMFYPDMDMCAADYDNYCDSFFRPFEFLPSLSSPSELQDGRRRKPGRSGPRRQ